MPRLSLLAAGAIVLALVYVLLRSWAASAAYYPLRYPAGDWAAGPPRGAVDVWLVARDGVRIHSWWLASPGAPRATLFLHGNAGNLSHRRAHIEAIRAAGSAVLAIDYRGYGRSSGRPSEAGLYQDAAAAYDHLLASGYPPGAIILHGESLGTAVAVHLAASRGCAGLVLEAPFPSGAAMAARVLPLLGPLLFRGFDSLAAIARVRASLLTIHGDQDDIVPIALGRRLFEAAGEPKTFWTVAGAGHNDLPVTSTAYREQLQAFYATLPAAAR